MAEHGGYRKPSKPAAVSGPGKFASRTDGQPIRDLPDAAYGEQTEFREIQGGAPMSDTSGTPTAGVLPGAPPLPTGFGEPTEFPDEAVDTPTTAGVVDPASSIQQAKKYLPLLARIADDPDSPDEVRALYQFVRDAD